MSFAREGTTQQLLFPLDDAKKLLKTEKECEVDQRELQLRKDQDAINDQRIANLEKENDLLKRESDLKDRILVIKDMEIEAQKKAFIDMKEISDRAIKLAEVGKPKSNFQLLGLLGMAAFVIGVLVAM